MANVRCFLAMLIVACSFTIFGQDNGQERLRNPLTTKGDMITTDGHVPQRIAVCPDGQLRVGDSTQALGWRCASPSVGSYTVSPSTAPTGKVATGQNADTTPVYGFLPVPGPSQLGGVNSVSCSAGTHVVGINTNGSVTCSADSGGGGGGASAVAGLTDFKPARGTTTVTNDTVAGDSACSSSAPCNLVYNGAVTAATGAFSGVLSGTSASGTVYAYADNGVFKLGHNTSATLTCTGCTMATGVSGFPAGTLPLWSWTFTSNVFDSAGFTDARSAFTQNTYGYNYGLYFKRTSDTVQTMYVPTAGAVVGANSVHFNATEVTATISSACATAGTYFAYYDPLADALKVDTSFANFTGITFGSGIATANTGVTGYPKDTIHIARLFCGATANTWNAGTTAFTDDRPFLTTTVIRASGGLSESPDGHGGKTLSIDYTVAPKPPAVHFGSLPTASSFTNSVYRVDDCASSACTSGTGSAGTTQALFVSDGSVWINLSSNGGGGSSSTCDPTVLTNRCFSIDFGSAQQLNGANGLYYAGVPLHPDANGGTITAVAPTTTTPAGLSLNTGTTSGFSNHFMVQPGSADSAQPYLASNFMAGSGTFDIKCRVKPSVLTNNSADAERIFIGFTDATTGATIVSSGAMGIYYDSTDGSPAWKCNTWNAASPSTAAIPGAPTNTNELEVEFIKTATANSFSCKINGGTASTPITTNIPNTNMYLRLGQISTSNTTTKSLTMYACSVQITGLP
jgi:hypothetical protein